MASPRAWFELGQAVVEQLVQLRDPRFAQARVEGQLRLLPCALRFGALGAARGRGVTNRLRPSSPGPISTQPCASSGCRLRVSVEASSFMRRASSTGRIGPSRTTCDSSEYCVVFRPQAPTTRS